VRFAVNEARLAQAVGNGRGGIGDREIGGKVAFVLHPALASTGGRARYRFWPAPVGSAVRARVGDTVQLQDERPAGDRDAGADDVTGLVGGEHDDEGSGGSASSAYALPATGSGSAAARSRPSAPACRHAA